MGAMLERTRAALEDGQEAGLHLGAQLAVALRGERLDVLCTGLADAGRPMAEDVLLPWFSCTKVLTALAVLQQWERGAFGLDDPIAAHIPEFAAGGKGTVTIAHALTHTGGFRGPADAVPSGAPVDWAAMVAEICAAPLEPGWVPGERAAYHPRSGFQILAEVVQRVTDVPFADYVTEELIEPLGMVDGWVAMPADRQAAYGERMGAVFDTSGASPARRDDLAAPGAFAAPDGASGGVGPARDLVRVGELLLSDGEAEGGRLLQPETVAAMTARRREGMRDETFGAVIDWGLGIMVNSWHYERRPAPYGYGDHASRDTVGHGGVQSSVVFADRDNALAVALICNGMPGEPKHHRRTQPVLTALYEDLGLA